MAGNNRHARRSGKARHRRPASPLLRPADRAQALLAAGRLGEAFDAFCLAAAATPPDLAARAAFGAFLIANVPGRPHPDIDAVFAAALDQAWLRPDALAPAAIRCLENGAGALIGAEPDLAAPDVQALLVHPVLLALLRATPAATPRLEIFLARVRHAALVAGAGAGGVPLALLIALAEHADASGFALTLPARDAARLAAEAEKLPGLRARAVGGHVHSVALLGCHESLQALPESLWAAPALGPVLAAHVTAPKRAASIAASLTPITPIDASSAPVATQYEADPYPMWVREPVGLPVALPPVVARRADPRRVRRVLVAGCGTGQHALVAADRWPRASLLAIDLSRASLAHAIAKTDALGINRIRFALGDLLAVETLDERFAVIEAVGVLHHLADPTAGLKALAQALAPGRVMLVALYSRRARAGLAAARALADGAPESPAAIRAWRARSTNWTRPKSSTRPISTASAGVAIWCSTSARQAMTCPRSARWRQRRACRCSRSSRRRAPSPIPPSRPIWSAGMRVSRPNRCCSAACIMSGLQPINDAPHHSKRTRKSIEGTSRCIDLGAEIRG